MNDVDAQWNAWIDTLASSAAALGDPLAEIPVVVGDRLLENWIRHRVAERLDIATQLHFVTVDEAAEALVRSDDAERWWSWKAPSSDPWSLGAVRAKVLEALRALRTATDSPLPEVLRAYLGDAGGAAPWRELAFADEVARVVLRLARERPTLATAPRAEWTGEHAWLGDVCAQLKVGAPDAPAGRRLARIAKPSTSVPLHVAPLTAVPADVAALLHASGATGVSSSTKRGPLVDVMRGSAREVRFRPCHGPLREVEVLRDWLLHRFERDHGDAKRLDPQDVLVLTPSPETYGPLVLQVFARRGVTVRPEGSKPYATRTDEGGDESDDAAADDAAMSAEDDAAKSGKPAVPAIPVHVSHLGPGRPNAVGDVLLRLLECADERLDTPRLLGLLDRGPVQVRFRLGPDDVAALRELVVDSGARWGFDAKDRAAAEQPALHANTLAHGLERLALGRLLPDDTVVPGDGEFAPVTSMASGDAEAAHRVATLAAVVNALHDEVSALRAVPSATPTKWREHITLLLETFTDSSAALAWQRSAVDETLDEVLPAGDGVALERRAVRRLLEEAFTQSVSGTVPNCGAVSMRGLMANAVRPSKVVALLGMSDGAFPRAAVRPPWDPFSADDARSLDRALLHDVAAAASDVLWIGWTGYEMKRGERLPACVPVEELAQDLGVELHGEGTNELDAVFRRPARHPWYEKLETWDDEFAALPKPASLGAATTDVVTEMTARAVADALTEPSKFLLKNRLDVYVPEDEDAVEGREPVELDGLGTWKLRDAVLQELRATNAAPDDVKVDELAQRLLVRWQGEGEALPGAAARLAVREQVEFASAVWTRWVGTALPGARHDVEYVATVFVGGITQTVRAHVERLSIVDGITCTDSVVASDPKGKYVLRQRIVQLVAAIAMGTPVAGRVIGLKAKKAAVASIASIGPKPARAELEKLLGIVARARREAIPLFAKTSQTLVKGADEKTRYEAERGWYDRGHDDDRSAAERDNRWIATLHRDYDLHAELSTTESVPGGVRDLAKIVWGFTLAESSPQPKGDEKPAVAPKSDGKATEAAVEVSEGTAKTKKPGKAGTKRSAKGDA